MDPEYAREKVGEFINAMDLQQKDSEFWYKLIKEEDEELLKEIADLIYVTAGFEIARRREGVVLNWLEMLIHDLKDVYPHSTVKKAFDRVHESNMSKLWEDGKPRYNEDGKVVKPPHYVKPDLKDLV